MSDAEDRTADDANRVPAGTAREVLDTLARAIVEDPESIVIEAEERRNDVVLRLHAAPDDLGRLIGRRGRVAQAIRTLVRAAGAKDGVDVSVDIVD